MPSVDAAHNRCDNPWGSVEEDSNKLSSVKFAPCATHAARSKVTVVEKPNVAEMLLADVSLVTTQNE